MSATTSYNPAAQRILGGLLCGPLVKAEIWPTWEQLDDYERHVGWIPYQPLPADALSQMDFFPGVRQHLQRYLALLSPLTTAPGQQAAGAAEMTALHSGGANGVSLAHTEQPQQDGSASCNGADCSSSSSSSGGDVGAGVSGDAARSSTGHGSGSWAYGAGQWRRVADMDELREAVAELMMQKEQSKAQQQGVSAKPAPVPMPQGLLWLPTSYEVYPLDSTWTAEHLSQGNIWVLPAQQPAESHSAGSSSGASGTACTASSAPAGTSGGPRKFLGVMVLAYYRICRRMFAGIHAADNAAAESALAFSMSREKHLIGCIVRWDNHDINNSSSITSTVTRGSDGAAGGAGVELVPGDTPRPGLYDVLGGANDFWLYGSERVVLPAEAV